MADRDVRLSNLRRLLTQRGLGPTYLAERTGKSVPYFSDLLRGQKSFGEKVARDLEEKLELERGHLDRVDLPVSRRDPEAHVVSQDDGTLSVPRLAIAGSMGPGADLATEEIVIGRMTVSPNWVSRSFKKLTSQENLRFIHGYGDSMEPTFRDGDVMLVDAGIRDAKIDGIYVLEANERIYIKRVRQKIDGTFEISSDNPNVKTVDVLDGRNPVEVRGRVIHIWNGRTL